MGCLRAGRGRSRGGAWRRWGVGRCFREVVPGVRRGEGGLTRWRGTECAGGWFGAEELIGATKIDAIERGGGGLKE